MIRAALGLVASSRRRPTATARPIAVGGARELVPLLVRELRAGGDASAVREGQPAGAAVFVWIGKPDVDALRAATRAHVPIVGVTDGESLPYVLDTNLVVVRPGEGLPTERITRAIAAVVPDGWESVARRLPVLRTPLVDEAIRRQALANARAAASVDRARAATVLTVRQLRLARGIASAHGSERLVAGTLAYLPFSRAILRRLGRRLPARRLVRAGLAYAVTRAVGEAAKWSVRSRS